MCNISPYQGYPIKGRPPLSSLSRSPVALAGIAQLTAPPLTGGRRRWTTGELTEILAALATLRTSDIAHTLGVNPKALRSALRRNGVSSRAIRFKAKWEEPTEDGLVVRRSKVGPSAAYGAAALEDLDDDACHWPCGDPAEPDFAFCCAPAIKGRSYCAEHTAQAFRRRGRL